MANVTQHLDDILVGPDSAHADAVIGTTTGLTIISWNAGARDLFGYTFDGVKGKPLGMLLDRRQAPALLREMKTELARQGTGNFTTEGITKDGRRVIMDVLAKGIRSASGKHIGNTISIRDITTLRGLEQQIQQSEKMAMTGKISTGIAHEIGTPLNVISGCAEVLMSELRDSPEAQRELQVIISQTDRIAQLIKRLLEFARPAQLRFVPLDVREVLEESLGIMECELEENTIRVVTHFEEGLPALLGDKNELQQVFLNFILNAIQAMAGDGDRPNSDHRSTLTVTAEATRDAIEDAAVRITFSDTGAGISRTNLDKIFDPFFTTKELGVGTGLGLAICQRIVSQHCGRTEVESEVGKGTQFTLLFPIHPENIPTRKHLNRAPSTREARS